MSTIARSGARFVRSEMIFPLALHGCHRALTMAIDFRDDRVFEAAGRGFEGVKTGGRPNPTRDCLWSSVRLGEGIREDITGRGRFRVLHT